MNKNNPLMCDLETGICEVPGTVLRNEISEVFYMKEKSMRILYFTDPICSFCWGIEGLLRKLELEYGDNFIIEHHMGGLLPSLEDAVKSGSMSLLNLTAHWEEVGDYLQMPINGNIWFENPIQSSYPPSIAFKVAELQDKKRALLLLRILREMLFVQKRNISDWTVIEEAISMVGLNLVKLKRDYANVGQKLLKDDLKLAHELGIQGFPTLLFYNDNKLHRVISGYKPYNELEQALLSADPDIRKRPYPKDASSIIKQFRSLTIKELSIISGESLSDSEQELSKLVENKLAYVIVSSKGNLWRIKE